MNKVATLLSQLISYLRLIDYAYMKSANCYLPAREITAEKTCLYIVKYFLPIRCILFVVQFQHDRLAVHLMCVCGVGCGD